MTPRSDPDHETDRLNDRHDRKDNAHGSGRAGSEPRDKKGIRIVKMVGIASVVIRRGIGVSVMRVNCFCSASDRFMGSS